jgi:hypothetical protein
LPEWLEKAGFGEVLPSIDVEMISLSSERLIEAMNACVPAGFFRVPGVGLQRAELSA